MSSLLGNFHCTQTCTYTQTRTDSKPFSISACLYAALVSKCRSYTDPKDLQRSGAAQDHARFLYACVCVCVCMVLQRVCGLSMCHVVYHMFKITSCRGQVSRQGIEYL